MVPIVCPTGRHCQFHDIAKGANPGKRVRNRESDRFEVGKVETAREMGGVVGRIRESCHPRFEKGSGHSEHGTLERCIRVRGIRDLETRQHSLRVVGSSRRLSPVGSRISGGREDDIVVSCTRSHDRDQTEAMLSSMPTKLCSQPHHLRRPVFLPPCHLSNGQSASNTKRCHQ